MANFLYDPDTDTWYGVSDSGGGWIIGLFILVLPFAMVAFFIQDVSEFVHTHMVLSCLVFLALSYLFGYFLYRKRDALYPKVGYIAVLISILPCGLAQLSAFSSFWENENLFSNFLGWLLLTFLSVSLTFFVIHISLLFNNGIKHLRLAIVYLALTIVVLWLF